MKSPVLVDVTRGAQVESRHPVSLAVTDAAGRLVMAHGDVDHAVFPRSAVKAFQALPLLESGAADRFGLTPAEIALACSSHSGEEIHAQTSAAMLAKAGRDVDCLECGAHWPMGEDAARRLAREGKVPTALNNNCSGKHAGFVCLACGSDEDPKGYIKADHFVQRETRRAMEEMMGVTLDPAKAGTDGCSIPTYATPLTAMARGFARLATGEGLSATRAQAARRIRESVARHPHMVAGTGRFDTDVMSVTGERAFTKTGAEGVFCAALPGQGLGVAIKCGDGAGRAAEAVMAQVIARFVPLTDDDRARLAPRLQPVMKNWNGVEVGRINCVLPD